MREIIHIQIGQSGNNISTKFWETIAEEHGISANRTSSQADLLSSGVQVYFNEVSYHRYVPRAVCMSMESSTLDVVRNSPYGPLFSPDNYIFGNTQSSGNFAQAYFNEGAEIVNRALDCIRAEAERCDCIQGLQLIHSIGGGCGSGAGGLLLTKLRDEYPERIIQTFSIFPNQNASDRAVEPYNTVLGLSKLVEFPNHVFCLDNEALFNICTKNVVGFENVNKLIANVISGITTCVRFPGQHNTDLRKLNMNLIPFPNLHFLVTSHAPILSRESRSYHSLNVLDVSQQLFDPKNIMIACDTRSGKYITVACIFRGKASLKEINGEFTKIHQKFASNFIESFPNNIFYDVCNKPPPVDGLAMTLIANSTAIRLSFDGVLKKYTAMFKRKAFLHGYIKEGMDEADFVAAEQGIREVVKEYQDVENFNDEDVPEIEEGEQNEDSD